MHRLRGSILLTLVIALVGSLSLTAAAQTSTSSSGAASKAQGVTDTTIKVGFPTIDFEKLKALGVKIDRGDEQKIVDALIAGVNSRGGINGRKLEGEVVKFDISQPASTEASCIQLTEDDKVFAVLGGYGNLAASANKCVADHKVALVLESVDSDTLARSSAASPVISAGASAARQIPLFAELLAKKGVFKGKTVGIVSDTTTAGDVKQKLLPALKKYGVKPKVVLVDDAAAGDTSAVDANWDVFAEKLKAEGVDHVILVGSEIAAGYPRMLQRGYDAQVSTPNDLNLGGLGRAASQLPPSSYDGALTVSALTDGQRFPQPDNQQCIKDFEKANPSIKVKNPDDLTEGETDWGVGINTTCTALGLFTKIATAAGKDLDNASFFKAAQGLTQNFTTALSPYNTLGPNKFDANNGLTIAVFDHTIGEKGGLKPQGKPVNLG
ncbi:MAG: ABC transporter substrate-binding protein [Acidimicrobiia bacterium]